MNTNIYLSGFIVGVFLIVAGIVTTLKFSNSYLSREDWLILANLVLAGAAVIGIFLSRNTNELMRKNSILDNRPYVFVDNEMNFSISDNEIRLSVKLNNTGKSTANNVYLESKKAIFIDSRPVTKNDQDNLYSSKTLKDEIKTKGITYREIGLSVFPQQALPLEPVTFYKDNLKKSFQDEGKSIFALFTLSYDSLPFDGTKKHYKINYELVIWWNNNKPASALLCREIPEK